MLRVRVALSAIMALGCMTAAADLARSQGFPQRPIKLVVPFPAGGANDTAARLVAQGLSSRIGQNVIVENQGGAGGTIGARQVATAPPDGHTLLMVVPTNTFGTAPLLYKLDYDPMKAFAPVAMVAADKPVMATIPAVPVKTVQELVRYAKANPGKLNYGSAIGIGPHFLVELFKIRAGVDIVHIPYRGGAPMIADLLGGQIQLTVNNKSVLLPHILEGRLKPLAVTAAERWSELPDVPTLIEAGYMDAPFDALFGIVAPAGTPATAINTVNAAINEALRAPETRASFAKLGIEPRMGTPEDFAKVIAVEAPKWAEIVRITGIKVE
jgi:tripartite-type tricarboxylate transporter receptor subunit TctC